MLCGIYSWTLQPEFKSCKIHIHPSEVDKVTVLELTQLITDLHQHSTGWHGYMELESLLNYQALMTGDVIHWFMNATVTSPSIKPFYCFHHILLNRPSSSSFDIWFWCWHGSNDLNRFNEPQGCIELQCHHSCGFYGWMLYWYQPLCHIYWVLLFMPLASVRSLSNLKNGRWTWLRERKVVLWQVLRG